MFMYVQGMPFFKWARDILIVQFNGAKHDAMVLEYIKAVGTVWRWGGGGIARSRKIILVSHFGIIWKGYNFVHKYICDFQYPLN